MHEHNFIEKKILIKKFKLIGFSRQALGTITSKIKRLFYLLLISVTIFLLQNNYI